MFSISFNYRESQYEALIRVVKEKDNKRQYRITVMNGELEVLLYGHHLLMENDGKLDFCTNGIPQQAAELRTIIAEALESYQATALADAN
jgi:hypothetical protein